jgi:hypothetical protein
MTVRSVLGEENATGYNWTDEGEQRAETAQRRKGEKRATATLQNAKRKGRRTLEIEVRKEGQEMEMKRH